jgi:tRNA 2-selenouridine synthase
MQRIEIEEFLSLRSQMPVFDVRSPAEFVDGHIPGAISLPLFDNEERKIVGTIYKKSGREAAIYEGLGFVGKKMQWYVKEAQRHVPGKKLLIHCWRGGMRSESLAWLLGTAGFEVFVLIGGYKSYRQYIRMIWERPAIIHVVSGKTGSGKTEILKHLKNLGQQVLDLEGLAHHKGSAFGAIGELPQPSNEQFENDLADQWFKLDLSQPVWLEDESHYIGRVFIPDPLFQQKQNGKIFCVEIPHDQRIQRLIKDYASFPKSQLIESIEKISRRLGGQHVKTAVEAIENDNFATAIDIVLYYYDKTYAHGLSQKIPSAIKYVNCPGADAQENALWVLKQSLTDLKS